MRDLVEEQVQRKHEEQNGNQDEYDVEQPFDTAILLMVTDNFFHTSLTIIQVLIFQAVTYSCCPSGPGVIETLLRMTSKRSSSHLPALPAAERRSA